MIYDDDDEIKKQAVWAISNCTVNATFEQFVMLDQKGILKALSSTLKMKDDSIL